MTISVAVTPAPVPAVPGTGAGHPATGGAGEAGGGAFAALVAGLLAPPVGPSVPVGPVGLAGESVPDEEGGSAPTAEGATTDGTGQDVAVPATGLPAWLALGDQVVPVLLAGSAAGGAAQAADAAAAVTADGPAYAPTSEATPATTGGSGTVAAGAGASDGSSGSPSAGSSDGSSDGGAATGDGAVPTPRAEATQFPAGAGPLVAPDAAPDAGPVAASPLAAPVAGAVPAGAPAAVPPGTPEGARPSPVVAQVVPEVTRMVSRGDGVHRLTMRLQPEALGEVRVTLTVRDGEVHVRLAAGEDARRALVEGAPELRRVLELAGGAEARVVVRDLGATPLAPTGSHTTPGDPAGTHDSSTGTSTGTGGDAPEPGRGRGEDQHARTRGGATARDGLTDGASPLRPDPVGGAPRGIDLTM